MPKRSRIQVIAALALVLVASGTAIPQRPADLVGSFVWRSSDPKFGGMSAIHVEADGTTFTVLSDAGAWTKGHLIRDVSGSVMAVKADPIMTLQRAPDEKPSKARIDAEGLAMAADGTFYISSEGPAMVRRYPALQGPATAMPRAKEFRAMQRNSSLEALAIDKRGWLYTMPERSGATGQPFPIYRFRNGEWDQPFSISRIGDYLISDAAVGPDGRLYVLERAFHGLLGFSSRVRRFGLTKTAIGKGQVVFESRTGQHDNLEGLSVWRDANGALRLTMISDDNFRFFQQTQIVEYRVPG